MSIICLICKDAITSESVYNLTSGLVENDDIVIATKCGHLYHKVCLKKYYHIQRQDDEDNGRRLSPTLCPKCKRVVILENTIRIYPEEDEVDDQAYNKLLKEKCDLHKNNVKLKAENDHLNTQLQKYQNGWVNNECRGQSGKSISPSVCNLKEGVIIIFFRGVSDEPLKGTVQSISSTNETYHAEILLESGELNWVPIAELILYTDYYGDDIDNEYTATGIQANDDSNPKDKNFVSFKAEFNMLKSLLDKVVEDVGIFSAEPIDGVVFYIENQKKIAASLKRRLISLDNAIKKLRTMKGGVLERNEIEAAECIFKLEGNKEKAMVKLRDASNVYNIALPQVQKIKSFIKAGFLWLNDLETKVKSLAEDPQSGARGTNLQDQFGSIDKEIQSRRFLIRTVTQAVEKFTEIPNSKIALPDQTLLNSKFSKFKCIETQFEIKKTALV